MNLKKRFFLSLIGGTRIARIPLNLPAQTSVKIWSPINAAFSLLTPSAPNALLIVFLAKGFPLLANAGAPIFLLKSLIRLSFELFEMKANEMPLA